MAIKLAARLDGEIINTDSRQVYADFPIITAQPSREELASAPHHLYGFLPSDAKINAGQWLEVVRPVIRDIKRRGKTPIFTGGTGLYFHALLHGLAEIPPIPRDVNERLEKCLKERGAPWLHGELARVDPDYAAKVHPNDRNRIGRAMAVFEATGKPFTWWHANSRSAPLCKGPLFVIDIALHDLEPRLEERINQMIDQGAKEEARKAWEKTPSSNAPGWTSIGCRELAAMDDKPWEELRRLWLRNTRAYAKRQLTWFKARSEAIWVNPGDEETLIREYSRFLSRYPEESFALLD